MSLLVDEPQSVDPAVQRRFLERIEAEPDLPDKARIVAALRRYIAVLERAHEKRARNGL